MITEETWVPSHDHRGNVGALGFILFFLPFEGHARHRPPPHLAPAPLCWSQSIGRSQPPEEQLLGPKPQRRAERRVYTSIPPLYRRARLRALHSLRLAPLPEPHLLPFAFHSSSSCLSSPSSFPSLSLSSEKTLRAPPGHHSRRSRTQASAGGQHHAEVRDGPTEAPSLVCGQGLSPPATAAENGSQRNRRQGW